MLSSLAVRRAVVAVLAVLGVLIAGLGASVPASSAAAAPAAPTGLSPNGATTGGNPILQWNRVAGADRYDVELSSSPSFATNLWRFTTTNRRVVPDIQLPSGRIYWRVKSFAPDGASAWSEASWSRDALAGPDPLSPASGATLSPPAEPILISWTPVAGATGYTLQVGKDPQFVDSGQFITYDTKASSYVVPDPLVSTEYYWRVKSTFGPISSDWSAVRSYQLGALAKPVLTAPADSASTSVVDVVLDWEPVLGARVYNLQISTDQNFNTVELVQNGIHGTRFSPPVTLDNDQYYWRVSPVDAAGNTRDWSSVDTWTFRRHWPHQPKLEYPSANTTVSDPFYYQWSPVRHASRYELQMSTAPDFSQNLRSCLTVHTTYTPTSGGDCFPGAAGTYYWRVLAYDNPRNVVTDGIGAEVRRFSYYPGHVQLVSPAYTPKGSANVPEVSLPTFRWQATAGASEYEVTITDTEDGGITRTRTTGTSWTPRTLLRSGRTYRWQVQTVSSTGRMGTGLLPDAQSVFRTVSYVPGPTTSVPQPTTPTGLESRRFPTLTWTPVEGASNYQIWLRPVGSIGWSSLNDRFVYPAGEDTGFTWLVPDTYEFRVEAWNGNQSLGSGPTARFRIVPPAATTGERVALSGNAVSSPTQTCDHELTDAPGVPMAEQQCQGLRATPVMAWDPNPDAGGYVVWLSRDQQMTNVIDRFPTDQNVFIPPRALIDSQAGSAFYWYVQPCTRAGQCLGVRYADHAFNKLSKPVQLVSPAAGDHVANDVTFTWRDYLETSQDATTPGTHTGIASVEPDVEALQYRFQVDDDPNFQSPLDTVVVDQTTYTPYANTYPEGPLYWRVQAIDGTSNNLTWSEPSMFEKRSPSVRLASPTGNVATSGAAPLRWHPLAHASSYDVEVYRNADIIGQGTNLMIQGNNRQVAVQFNNPFPVSDLPYTWRVRPRDAANRPGQWTDLADPAARFRVVGAAPTPTAPQPGTLLAGNDALFTWQGVDGASEYRFERRAVGGPGLQEVIRTPALAWAPGGTLGDGRYEWRVVSLNNAGADMKASPWQQFVVDGTRPSVSSHKPATRITRSGNLVVRFSEPVTAVTNRTFRMMPKGSRKQLSAVVTLSSDRLKATLNPARNLKAGGRYTVKLSSAVRDDAGNALQPHSWAVRAR